jgi:hypothetical protein
LLAGVVLARERDSKVIGSFRHFVDIQEIYWRLSSNESKGRDTLGQTVTESLIVTLSAWSQG